MRKPEQDSHGVRGGPRTTRARLPFWSMSIVNIRSLVRSAVAAALVLAAPAAASAQMEFHYQYGKLVNPFSGDGVASSILTIQQAAAWSLGESFFFIDYLDDNRPDGFNDVELYGEWYPTLSLSRISRRQVGAGPLRDVQLIGGINFGGDADFFKYLPGARLSWNVPGFVFFNTDITAFIDANNGVAEGGAPRTSDSYMVDVNWGAAFELGTQAFWFTGHAEYIGATTDELGGVVEDWILAQPQLGWDIGKALTGSANQLFIGVEYQYWRNKLGVDVDENLVQLWIMWRL